MRAYKTIRALRAGEVVELEGCLWRMRPGAIEKDDWYIAERNTGPQLLTALSFSVYHGRTVEPRVTSVPTSEGASWVNPFETAYPYDTHECVRVEEVHEIAAE
jgi:hypothetical protein